MYDKYNKESTGLYSLNDTLYNGTNGFSGNINNWTKVQFNWIKYMAVKKSDWIDTVIVRFNFISDATENAHEGWIIDNIRLFMVEQPGSVNESAYKNNLEIYPNPVQTNSLIKSKDQKTIKQIRIYNLTGQLLKTSEIQCSEFTFERENLTPGSYLLKCIFKDDTSETLKIIIK
jgi:hypothetical protein